jgi:hypothetical protein
VTGHEHSDDLADSQALVQAVRDERTADVAVILRHCSLFGVVATLAKITAEILDEQQVCPEHFRVWSAHAIHRK